MQTSKLYSEIEKVIYEKTPSLPYNSAYQVRDAAKSIEQLLLDKMDGLLQLVSEKNYSGGNNSKGKGWFFFDSDNGRFVETKELIRLYLNK